MYKNTVFILLIWGLFACSNRDRDNIFDPQNDKKTIDVGFSATSFDSLIFLSWNSPANIIYKNINIYRKTAEQNDFELLHVVNKDSSFYKDYDVKFDEQHSYYLTINGETEESYPTKPISITPGPGSIWILDRYLWEISKLSYDLSSVSIRKAGAWRPENMAFGDRIGLITYPTYRYLEIFNLNNGNIIDGNINLKSPFDATFDPQHGLFWVVDSSGSLVTIDTVQADEKLVYQNFSKPVQIDYLENKLYILDKGFNAIYIFNTSPLLSDSIYTTDKNKSFENLKLFRLDKKNKKCYILDGITGNNILYRFNLSNGKIEPVYQDSLIYTFDVNRDNETIWIVSANKVNSSLMQLSYSGERLHIIDGLIRPTDMKVSPYNGNIVVADFYGQKVYHYRPDLSLVGIYNTIGDPSKVYIE